MKLRFLFGSLLLAGHSLWAHGPGGHRHVPEEYHCLSQADACGHMDHKDHSAHRWWGAELTTGWESRHIHYGVNETGNSGAYTTEVAVWVKDFMLGAWSGFGMGNNYQEWDFTAAYNLDLGPVFFIPGYNFRYTPQIVESGHTASHDDHDHETHHDHDHKSGHSHNTYGNELFLVLGTHRIPYVTPAAAFIWDLNNLPGAFLELRLDGDLPLWKDVIRIQPYALLGLNFGYNTTDYYGWNNFQFGTEVSWNVQKWMRLFAGINYSVALPALEEIGQDNVVWVNVGISFKY